MARDAALLERPGVRIYVWDGPWVSLGISQRPEKDLLPGCAIPSVRRPTGGRAVLHGHDLTLGYAVPYDRLGAHPPHLRPIYRALVAPIIAALGEVGIACALGEEIRGPLKADQRSADCFALMSANDVIALETGHKACGVALKLGPSAALVQASIPIQEPLVPPREVFALPAPCHPLTLDIDAFADAFQQCMDQKFYHED